MTYLLPAFAQSHIPVYSTLPAFYTAADVPTLADNNRIATRRAGNPCALRDLAVLLPWSMDQLDGSLWCNLSTGRAQVVKLGHLSQHESTSNPKRWELYDQVESIYRVGLGLWWGERYVIDNWLRVDHLPSDVRLAWFDYEIAHTQNLIARYRREIESLKISTLSTRSENIRWKKREIKQAQAEIESIEQARRQFAESAGSPLVLSGPLVQLALPGFAA